MIHPVRRTVEVLGVRLSYLEAGTGPPIVFQHGNPTSSILWRKILPPLADCGRCLAIDLPGMGDSAALPADYPHRYRLRCHQEFFDAALSACGVDADVTLVLHDWGTALGFDWARRNEDRMRALAYLEGFVCPLEWEDWPESGRDLFQALRGPAGEQLILEKNIFVERILPGSIIRHLEEDEMEAYRAPYREAGDARSPTLAWPRELPVAGEPADVVETVQRYSHWLLHTQIPKLFINGEPGAVLTGRQREFCRQFPNQEEVTVKGIHFLQEDSPEAIAEALLGFLAALPGRHAPRV